MGSLYTNTGKVGSVVGLVLITVVTAYVANHSEKIVDGTVSLAKKGMRKAKELFHKNKDQYQIWARDYDGKLYDTGRRIQK